MVVVKSIVFQINVMGNGSLCELEVLGLISDRVIPKAL